MVKEPKKAKELSNNPFLKELQPNSNIIYNVNFSSKKPKSEIDKDYYQKHKERKKLQRRERYQQQKELAEQQAKEQLSKYYGAEAIKILMSLKKYTELNQGKRQLWLDFNWTLQDCQKSFKEGYIDIVAIMKLEQVANKLVRDYWDTAKSEERQKSKSWNSLDYDEQQRLIRYWGYEKARVENSYIEERERLEKQSQEYLKEIELAKFHEERGKIKCSCYACEEKKTIRKQIKAEQKKIIVDYEAEQKKSGKYETEMARGECGNCFEYRKIDPDSGLCKKCS